MVKKVFISLLLVIGTVIFPCVAFPQSALSQLEQAAGRSASSVYVPAVSSPSRVGSASSTTKSLLPSSSSSVSSIVTGVVIQSLFNSLMNPTPQKSQEEIAAEKAEAEREAAEAEKQRIEEAARQQAIHDNLVNSSKTLSDSPSLDFKSLDGDMENMRKEAADQFQPQSGESTINNGTTISSGNNFFGTPLSEVEIQTVIEPATDPVYKDVKEAVDLTDEYLKNEKLVVEIIGQSVAGQAKGEPIVKEEPKLKSSDCIELNEKLARYRSDMVRFREWNAATLTELEKWKEQNDEAFWNAVKDGASAAFGVFLDYLDDTRSSTIKIKKFLDDNEGKFLQEKIFKPEEIITYNKLLDQRITTCNVVKFAKESMKPWDYVNLSKNLLHSTTAELAKSDGDCIAMIKTLQGQGFLSDTPLVDAGQFLAGEIINKFMEDPSVYLSPNSLIKGSMKIPYVTIAQLIVDEGYNVADWLTSHNRICTLRDADGKASEAVKKIQADMDNIKLQIKNCPGKN